MYSVTLTPLRQIERGMVYPFNSYEGTKEQTYIHTGKINNPPFGLRRGRVKKCP